MPTTTDYDILIIGGGMVGASLACALGNTALRIGIIEAVPLYASAQAQPSYDDRTLALAYGSRRIFEGMGLWPALVGATTPIKKIHVSDRGHFGVTHIDCADEGVEALGYVVVSRTLGQTLMQALHALPHVDLICPAQLTNITTSTDHAQVIVNQNGEQRTLTARLVVAADGGKSAVREQLKIPTRTWDYHQTAIITNITPQRPHNNIAYERFTSTGPIAMLPMSNNRCAVVWTVASGQADAVMRLTDEAFLAGLQNAFGHRLGRLQKTGMRHAYPLVLTRALEHVRPHLAVIGNAAHTLHPIAGQGFNLGLRDAAALAQVIVEAQRAGHDIGSLDVLNHYAAWRRADQMRAIAFTDSLVRVFTNPLAPFALGRNLGLLAVDLLPPLKHLLARQTMGLVGKLPRLARGLGL